ncbi:hypothetical protein PB1_02070 [Bacillus methanolicus PB1]|uniref:Uncharacterized protein n=1 Tax=Bacillus methanolicus PB1 TaxID=997296 RepID=I3E5B8_BACMT|nr:hypothetical protein PB1_02070 [Bacillus methanolicus PB1]
MLLSQPLFASKSFLVCKNFVKIKEIFSIQWKYRYMFLKGVDKGGTA